MSQRSVDDNQVLNEQRSVAKKYDSVSFGAAFASDIMASAAPGSSMADVANPRDVNVRDISDKIRRFGDNDTIKAAFPSSVSDAVKTEIADVERRDGLYAKSTVTEAARRGKKILDADLDLFPFDYVIGRKSRHSISVDKEDRMSPEDAKAKLHSVFAMYGIEGEPHEYLYSFTHSMLVTHALNGASLVGPGRAKFFVDKEDYSYGDVQRFLGPDFRRFFRAFADETAKAILRVLQTFDPGDSKTVRLCGQIRSVAVNRKLIQFPYLIHDSADACYRISNAEMVAVARSKQFVLNTGNVDAIEELEKNLD